MTRTAALALLLAARALPVLAYDDLRFLDPIKLQGVKSAAALAAGKDRLYVLDEDKSQLHILDRAGKFLRAVGGEGESPQSFSEPKGLAVARDGTVFVADTGNSRIQVLDGEGKFLYTFGQKGSEPGRLKGPEGVALGGFGRIFVSDTGNHRVQVFTREGIFLYGFGVKGSEPGQLSAPAKLYIDAGEHVFVHDSGNSRVQKFDPAARAVKDYPLEGADFALDGFGFLYALEPKPAKVREIAPNGFVAGAFGSKGSGVGQFKGPTSIAAGPDGLLYVLDAGNSRIQRIELSNKAKQEPVPPSTASKLLVAGPALTVALEASALAAAGDKLYAYLPEAGQFAILGRDGKELSRFGRKSGKSPEVTKRAEGLAASAKFGLFVSDTAGDKIQHFDAQGKFVGNVAQSTGFFDGKKKEGRVRSPRGAAVSEKGMLYVADTDNLRVDVFSPDGAFLSSFGPQLGPHELQSPVAVAWDPAGFVYVLDRKLKRIFKCEPSGGFLAAWGEEGDGPGQLEDPVALAFDGRSYLYALDAGAKRVAVFHKDDGRWVTNFFAEGKDDRGLQEPAGLAVQGEKLWIADREKGKLLAFTLKPLAAPPLAISTSVVEGTVELSWPASADPWVLRYQVYRATASGAQLESIGPAAKLPFKDSSVEPNREYQYRVAAQAHTGDLGPLSEPTAVFVPAVFNRAPVELSSVTIGNMLPANYKWYLKNPVGKAVVVNNVNVPFQNVKVSFRLKDFMDFATETVIPRLEAQGTYEVPLISTLNNKILEITEETPIQAEISVTYFEKGKAQAVSIAQPLRVYSRNSIIWDDPERINAFITTNDTPVLEFQKKVRHEAPAASGTLSALNPALVTALRLWNAVGEAGIRFQASPTNPFETVSEDPSFPVDYTQFPRETLKRKSGECDDVATLLASLLEGANVEAALLDYPGHIAIMFSLGESEPALVGLPEADLIKYEGKWWLPLEPTLAGQGFAESHRHALTAYREMEKTGRVRVIDPRKAVAAFEPVTMPATEWSAPTPEPAAVQRRVEADAKSYAERRYQFLKGVYEERLAADASDFEAMNRLGLLEVDLGRLEGARARFEKTLAADPGDSAALNNLGAVAFLKEEWKKAREHFERAAEYDAADAGIWLNLAKTSAKLKEPDKVREYGGKAIAAAAESDKPKLEAAVEKLAEAK